MTRTQMHERGAATTRKVVVSRDGADEIDAPNFHHRGKKLPRHLLYVKKYVDLDQYIEDFRKRKIIAYAKLPPAKRIELFGSTIVPIHVPLARWESAEQYEERFIQWLEKKKGLTLRELETSKEDDLERFYRVKFANLNATGEEAFIPPPVSSKRELPTSEGLISEERLPPSKKFAADGSLRTTSDTREPTNAQPKMSSSKEAPGDGASSPCFVKRPGAGASLDVVADAFTACGCARCLVEVTQVLAAKITELDRLVS